MWHLRPIERVSQYYVALNLNLALGLGLNFFMCFILFALLKNTTMHWKNSRKWYPTYLTVKHSKNSMINFDHDTFILLVKVKQCNFLLCKNQAADCIYRVFKPSKEGNFRREPSNVHLKICRRWFGGIRWKINTAKVLF